ncbi:hypothetical protein HA45_12835 [Pantoea rodasii]|nr:hypothetical protein HA45_12835 [Pantoea rodasii]
MNSDNEFLTIIRTYARVFTAILTTLVLFCAGVMTVLSYAINADTEERELKNQRASDYVSSLYREAETASRSLDPLAGQLCTDKTLRRLRHIVAVNPHIRSINVYSRNSTGCSSLEGSLPLRPISYSESRVPFYTTMKQEDGYIFYMVYFSSPSYLTGVAINGFFVRDALRYISPDAAFYPLQDFMELSPQGYVWENTHYPFVLVSSESINIQKLILKSRAVIFFILAVSLLVGWLTYVSTGLINTPRFVLRYYLHKKVFTRYISPLSAPGITKLPGWKFLCAVSAKQVMERRQRCLFLLLSKVA